MHAEIITIGTELLLGEIVDTNATKLAQMLREVGIDLYYKSTVGDSEMRLTEVLNMALERSDMILTSGGIGPTVDDITRQSVANATGRKLVYSHELEQQIAARFRSFGREMTDNNKRQAYIPEGALPLANPVGTAPCFLCEDMRDRGFIISLPGVPRELEYMMQNSVIPLLIKRMGGAKVVKVRVLRTCAVGESNIDRHIGDLMTEANPTVGLSAHAGQTDVRITAKADNDREAEALISTMEAKLRERLGVAIYGIDKETVPEVVGRMLTDKGITLSVIDTLTGGQLVRDLVESGFNHVIAVDLHPSTMAEALQSTGIDARDVKNAEDSVLAASFAQTIAPDNGSGLALIGPFADNETFIALHGPGDIRLTIPGRYYRSREAHYIRRWLVIQAFDCVRRALVGELRSPVDWD
jgi:nicotinamide-nucleotide amidase